MSTATSVHDQRVADAIQDARARAGDPQVPPDRRPFPSPEDWRDVCIYFLMLDRFACASGPPSHAWNQSWGERQGGTFEGVRQRLPYLKSLGVNALWITPVVRNCAGSRLMTYHGYAAQDLLAVDERWASDGTRAKAEVELAALVRAAHDLGIWVVLDVVLNHTGEVFWYDEGGIRESFKDAALLHQSRDGGALPGVVWTNGYGNPEPAWRDELHPGQATGLDDAVYPIQLRDSRTFRRRGEKVSDRLEEYPELGFVPGDFGGSMRQLTLEYEASAGDSLRVEGRFPVLSLLLRAYQYLVARFDFDGLRIDTAKYVDPKFLQRFGTAMNEFAYTIGKKNFFQYGEVWDDAYNIARFVGRNGGSEPQGGFGIDAGLDFPVAETIRSVCTGLFEQRRGVFALRDVYDIRRNQDELICSHGDASSYFVLFLGNHDEHARIRHPESPDSEVRLCLGLLFTLPGVPCLYYGTEQDLQGTVDAQGNPTLDTYESVREALWGKFLPAAPAQPSAAQLSAPWPQGGTFQMLRSLIDVRRRSPALKYGRYYFRQVSGDGAHFGWPMDRGGVFAFSRVQADEEVLVVAYPNPFQPWTGWVEVDGDLNPDGSRWQVVFSTLGNGGSFTTRGYGPPPTRCAIQVTLASNELLVIARV